jgi:lipoprotein-releasing system ATP-binding protein
MAENIIVGKNLSKTYKTAVDEVVVFENLDVEINKATAVAIIGQSGRGKTTLLNILSGLDNPSGGNVLFNGEQIDALSEEDLSDFRNKNVGFIFQHHYLLEDFNALDNLLIPLRIRGTIINSEIKEKAMELLGRMGLKDRYNHYPDQLSGGERQRVAVARALMADPLVIFADEPTGSLDKANSANVEAILWDLKNVFHKTFVIATHNHEMAKRCDKIIEL